MVTLLIFMFAVILVAVLARLVAPKRSGQVFFATFLGLYLLPVYVVAAFGLCCSQCLPGQLRSSFKKKLSYVVIILTCISFRLALFCSSSWIKIRVDGLDEFRKQLAAGSRPAVVVGNHLSFIDTILSVSLFPLSRVGDTKMLVSNHLLKMPGLGTIVRAMGHLAVPFKANSSTGGHELDKEKMAEQMKIITEHVSSGKIAAWFPEGTMNSGNPHELMTFRAGGFRVPIDTDAEVWCFAYVGNSICWPKKAAIGGFPCNIGVKVFRLCESSCKAAGAGQDVSAQNMQLANLASSKVQEAITALVKDGFSGVSPEDKLNTPLL